MQNPEDADNVERDDELVVLYDDDWWLSEDGEEQPSSEWTPGT